MTKLSKFDAAEYLTDAESQQLYLADVSKENNPQQLIKALETVARAKGMAKTARAAGISREGLYKALSENGNPSFQNVCNILNACGVCFSVTPLAEQFSKTVFSKSLKDYFGMFRQHKVN